MLFRSQMVRFEPRIQRNLDRMNTPYVVLQNTVQNFLYRVAWAPIDDASSRLSGSSLLYMGGTSSIIRTVVYVLTRLVFVGFDVEALDKLLRKRSPDEDPEDFLRGPDKNWRRGRIRTVRMAHRAINHFTVDENSKHFTFMLRNFDPTTKSGPKAAQRIKELYGPQYDTKSMIDSLRFLPQVIKLVANMSGMDSRSDTNLIPVGPYREIHEKVKKHLEEKGLKFEFEWNSPRGRMRQALWLLATQCGDVARAVEIRNRRALYDPYGFLACSTQTRVVKIRPNNPGSMDSILVSTPSARASAAVALAQMEELKIGRAHV